MVMEYAGGGDLLQYVKKRKRLDEETTRAVFKQIVYGLGHCHCTASGCDEGHTADSAFDIHMVFASVLLVKRHGWRG